MLSKLSFDISMDIVNEYCRHLCMKHEVYFFSYGKCSLMQYGQVIFVTLYFFSVSSLDKIGNNN